MGTGATTELDEALFRSTSSLREKFLVFFGGPVLLPKAKAFLSSGLIFLLFNKLIHPSHQWFHHDYGEPHQVLSKLIAWQQSLLGGLDGHLVDGVFNLAIDRLESFGELGDILGPPHSDSHKVFVRPRDDPMCLKFLQEGIPELPPARN